MNSNGVAIWALVWFRVLISLLALEGSLRYAIWRYRMANWHEPFRHTVGGVAILLFTLFIFSLYGLFYSRIPPLSLLGKIVLFGGDGALVIGISKTLWTCFSVSCGLSESRIAAEFLTRALITSLITFAAYEDWFIGLSPRILEWSTSML